MQDVDGDGGAGQAEELGERGREVGAGCEGVEGGGGGRARGGEEREVQVGVGGGADGEGGGGVVGGGGGRTGALAGGVGS